MKGSKPMPPKAGKPAPQMPPMPKGKGAVAPKGGKKGGKC